MCDVGMIKIAGAGTVPAVGARASEATDNSQEKELLWTSKDVVRHYISAFYEMSLKIREMKIKHYNLMSHDNISHFFMFSCL